MPLATTRVAVSAAIAVAVATLTITALERRSAAAVRTDTTEPFGPRVCGLTDREVGRLTGRRHLALVTWQLRANQSAMKRSFFHGRVVIARWLCL